MHIQVVAKTRRAQIIGLDPPDGKDPSLPAHGLLVKPQLAHPFAAPALDEFQKIGMVDDPAHVGVFIIDAQGEAVCHGRDVSRGVRARKRIFRIHASGRAHSGLNQGAVSVVINDTP